MIMPPLIPPERIIAALRIRTTLLDIRDEIIKATKEERFAKDIITCLQQKKTPFKSLLDDWDVRSGIIYFRNRIYVPK